MQWSPELYGQYERERIQPAYDLADQFRGSDFKTILDVGCGSGMSTRVLAHLFPDADIVGVDTSPEMLAQAKDVLPAVTFLNRDASQPLRDLGKFDLIFCNSAMQWIENQRVFLQDLYTMVQPGGALAIQIPMFNEMAANSCIQEAASAFPGLFALVQPSYAFIRTPGWYYDLLSSMAAEVRMWRTDYYHQLESARSILSFLSGAALRPYFAMLQPQDLPIFSGRVLAEIEKSYPVRKNGKVLFTFRRLFLTAIKEQAK